MRLSVDSRCSFANYFSNREPHERFGGALSGAWGGSWCEVCGSIKGGGQFF